ncbi:hypothetical protein GCK32_016812 [Trichostrongylus colubriformis]|uniref:Uncharacterized protein n=1 Tax=Trichostrongylus colubriformis TaxID=6319 RepID=A0AAN8IND1_TRICO
MFLIVAVLGVFVVNTNAFTVSLNQWGLWRGGILTSDYKKAFIQSNSVLNAKLEWDDDLLEEVYRELYFDKSYWNEHTTVIYHRWNFQDYRRDSQDIVLPRWIPELLQKYGKLVKFLPAQTRYACNGFFEFEGPELTAACVYNVTK